MLFKIFFHALLFSLLFAGCGPSAWTIKGVTLKQDYNMPRKIKVLTNFSLGIEKLSDHRPEQEKVTFNTPDLAQTGDQIFLEPINDEISKYLLNRINNEAIFSYVNLSDGYSVFKDDFILTGSVDKFVGKIYGNTSGNIETIAKLAVQLTNKDGRVIFHRSFEDKNVEKWRGASDAHIIFKRTVELLQATIEDVCDQIVVCVRQHLERLCKPSHSTPTMSVERKTDATPTITKESETKIKSDAVSPRPIVHINNVFLSKQDDLLKPITKIKGGQRVNMVIQYTLSGAPANSQVNLVKCYRIFYKGLTVVDEALSDRKINGSHEATTPMTIPTKLDSGKYEFQGAIKIGEEEISKKFSFTIQ